MELEKETKEMMGSLSQVNLYFNEFVKKNPACLNRANFVELEEMRTRLFALQYWPTFVSHERMEMFRDAAVRLFNLIKSIPQRLFHNDAQKMGAYYGQPAALIDFQMDGVTEEHLGSLLGRGDFIFSPPGLKCLEYNIAGNLGGLHIPLWESLYLKNPLILQFLNEYGIKIRNRNLMAQYLEHCIRSSEPIASRFGDTEINLTLVLQSDLRKNDFNMGGYLDTLYNEILQEKYPSLKGNVFMCDYPDLDVQNDKVYYKGRRIHVITEWHFGVMPPPFMKSFKAGNIRIMNGPITNIMSSKLNLALLSEYGDTDAFNDEEKETIKKYVPWSRKIVRGETTYKGEPISLADFILFNKDILVIKPSLGLGGEGVYLGKSMSTGEWEEVVKNAFRKKDMLVQELVESGSFMYRYGETGSNLFDMVWGFLIFGSQYSGAFLRVMLKKDLPRVLNAHQGAQVSIVFEVDE
jgi:hypothetical protein